MRFGQSLAKEDDKETKRGLLSDQLMYRSEILFEPLPNCLN